MLTIVLVGIALGAAWSLYRRPVLQTFAAYLLACLVTTALWLTISRGQPFLLPAYDHVSIVHVVVLASTLLSVAALMALHKEGWLQRGVAPRVFAIATTAGMAAGVMVALYPDFFLGPWPHLDPVLKTWHRSISELQPLLPTDAYRATQFLAQFTASLLAIPLMLHRLRHGTPGEQLAMLVSFCGLCLFGGLALAQMRWSGELQAATLLPWTLTTQHIMRSEVALHMGRLRLPLRSFALTAALLLQVVPGFLANAPTVPFSGVDPPYVKAHETCDWTNAIRAIAPMGPKGGILLTELWYGPEILWRTDFRVIGAPYEMPSAITDTRRFESGDESIAHEIIARRHVALVLVCGAAGGNSFADGLRGEISGLADADTFGEHTFRISSLSGTLAGFIAQMIPQ